MPKLVVIAVGGNSLVIDEEHSSVPDQYAAVTSTVRHIATIIEKGYHVVITRGNGPQVGFSLLRSEIARKRVQPSPLDYCVAETEGSIGYQFQMALSNELKRRSLRLPVVTVVTQVVVDRHDAAFKSPSKPIGFFYPKNEALTRIKYDGWEMLEDSGRGWRRVVASPEPKEIIEIEAIHDLISRGAVVIAGGGGGIPVVRDTRGSLHGVEAVIDKDFASALLAHGLKADIFLISTAVEAAYLNFGRPTQEAIGKINLKQLKLYLKGGHFKSGSMLPKIKAIISFLEKGGKKAIITDPNHLDLAIGGRAGTIVLYK